LSIGHLNITLTSHAEFKGNREGGEVDGMGLATRVGSISIQQSQDSRLGRMMNRENIVLVVKTAI